MTERLHTNKEKDLLEQFSEDIYAQIENLPEENKKRAFKNILKGYGIPWKDEYDAMWVTEKVKPEPVKEPLVEEVEKKKKNIWYKAGQVALATAAGVTFLVYSGTNQTNKKGGKDKESKKIEKPAEPKVEKVEEKKVDFDSRFDIETHSLLPDKGKEVYVFMAENDPNPGFGYTILDKDSAVQYVFNDKNKLVGQVDVGFGQDRGDEQNTSYEYNKGKMTTPAGGYMLLDTATAHDAQLYKGLGFSMYGISILGDTVYLGMHPMFPGEFAERDAKTKDGIAGNNNYSNGCVNVYESALVEIINPYIKSGAFCFVLQDAKSRASGAKFKAENVVKNLMPMVIKAMDNEEAEFEKLLLSMKTAKGRADCENKIAEIKARRARANKILSK